MAECQHGPEYRVGEPHFRGKAEDQRAEHGSRGACIDKNCVAWGTIGHIGQDQAYEWRNVEQQPIGDDSDPRIAPNSNESLSRQQAQQEDGRSSRNVVPVEGPDVANGDSVENIAPSP